MIDDYNYGVGGFGVEDQLLLQYRVQYWMHQRIWRWSIFLWSLGGSVKNSYILYHFLADEEKQQQNGDL